MGRIAAFPEEMADRGCVFGFVGSTGLSTVSQLHFEVIKNGCAGNSSWAKTGCGPAHAEGPKLYAVPDELKMVLTIPGRGS
jgi:murein DD-endopeptidase MepM/ murein hydrolase activator NlpD